MQACTESDQGSFWERLNGALSLQHEATQLAAAGEREQAAELERRAIALLLEATCLLEADEPALGTVRDLAAAGLSRLRALNRRSRSVLPRPRRRRALAG